MTRASWNSDGVTRQLSMIGPGLSVWLPLSCPSKRQPTESQLFVPAHLAIHVFLLSGASGEKSAEEIGIGAKAFLASSVTGPSLPPLQSQSLPVIASLSIPVH